MGTVKGRAFKSAEGRGCGADQGRGHGPIKARPGLAKGGAPVITAQIGAQIGKTQEVWWEGGEGGCHRLIKTTVF